MTIENSNFGMYLSSMQDVYKKILATGRDVYYCGYSRDLKQVFALPARVQKSDGSIEITGEDIKILTPILDKSRLEDIKQGEMKVFPYNEIDISDTFSLASLEGILKGEAVIVDYFHLD